MIISNTENIRLALLTTALESIILTFFRYFNQNQYLEMFKWSVLLS